MKLTRVSDLDYLYDRIDESLGRIDLRMNETTHYFETVSKKVDEMNALEKKLKK
jgi:hypothetical protein